MHIAILLCSYEHLSHFHCSSDFSTAQTNFSGRNFAVAVPYQVRSLHRLQSIVVLRLFEMQLNCTLPCLCTTRAPALAMASWVLLICDSVFFPVFHSIDDRSKSTMAYTDAVPLLLKLVLNFPHKHVAKELGALMINISLDHRNAGACLFGAGAPVRCPTSGS